MTGDMIFFIIIYLNLAAPLSRLREPAGLPFIKKGSRQQAKPKNQTLPNCPSKHKTQKTPFTTTDLSYDLSPYANAASAAASYFLSVA